MTHGSLFAGLGGADLAFHRCGVKTVWAAEKDPKCNSVRRRHFPDEETITDVASVRGARFRVDILSGGFPCQDISVAGKRAGLAGERSGLWWEFARVIAEQTPGWVLIENVGGLLSSNGTRDFGTILGTLAQLRYGFAYRVLDAQWWGVPQRRRRVFVVGCAGGDWRRAAEVLFEPESLPWDSPPSREAGTGVTSILEVGARTGGRPDAMQRDGIGVGQDGDPMFTLQAGKQHGIVAALTANGVGTCGADGNQGQAGHLVARTLRAEGFDASEDGTGRGTPLVPVAYRTSGNSGVMEQGDKTAALNTATDPAQQIIGDGMAVRRLMPIECERLQGFPDGWTQFGEHGEEIADGPRYRMLGNAIAVPVAEWIGKRSVAANSKRR